MDKDQFRKKSIQELKNILPHPNIYYKQKIIEKQLLNIIKQTNSKNILAYIPLKMEFNTKNLIKIIRRKSNINIFVPFMQTVSFKSVKYRLPIYKKKFGIYEPNNSLFKIRNIDLIIVPVVGVDGVMKRVGFGKGMYDRFFENLPNKPTVVFVQLKTCFTKKIITNEYDIRADYYITS
ncbi:MAG: 5-formyltetrahydrofolate cyclo-ligase (EC [uncultured Campylobacterales bacterium]|uniref:5-formyltetrahydrofolate cyclo-ligase n=1 Tax=uncultured Campylobacterales bacterium TaxID=352960 RepID=A0A6S6SKX0_9BACT|nr:MAG: 5-formyltetrahydrofolate cyclo-ligase (EC [uncultured Campylobacterales bacterium]